MDVNRGGGVPQLVQMRRVPMHTEAWFVPLALGEGWICAFCWLLQTGINGPLVLSLEWHSGPAITPGWYETPRWRQIGRQIPGGINCGTRCAVTFAPGERLTPNGRKLGQSGPSCRVGVMKDRQSGQRSVRCPTLPEGHNMPTQTKTITENGTFFSICTCTHCGERMEFDSRAAGQKMACPHCGMDTVPFMPKSEATPKPVVYATKKKKQGLLALGFAIQVAGILCMFIKYPLGIIPGLILLVVGGRMALKLICSHCGNYAVKEAKLCASCGAKFKGS
jgi:hypothetical protein